MVGVNIGLCALDRKQRRYLLMITFQKCVCDGWMVKGNEGGGKDTTNSPLVNDKMSLEKGGGKKKGRRNVVVTLQMKRWKLFCFAYLQIPFKLLQKKSLPSHIVRPHSQESECLRVFGDTHYVQVCLASCSARLSYLTTRTYVLRPGQELKMEFHPHFLVLPPPPPPLALSLFFPSLAKFPPKILLPLLYFIILSE